MLYFEKQLLLEINMISISAIGTANPPYKSHQLDTAERISASLHLNPAQKRLLKSIYKATGIEYRYSVLSDYAKSVGKFDFLPNNPEDPFPSTQKRMELYKQHALPLALDAIKQCLLQAPTFDKNNITHLITVSCTGMYAPGIDIEIIQKLNLKTTVKRTTINFMGCYGAFNGIKVAEAICKSDPSASVLLVCVELCTLHFQKKMDMDNLISNAIFADGAAAALIQSTSMTKKSLSLESFYCDLLPQTHQEMAWHIADSGFDIILSSYVPEVIEKGIAAFTDSLLKTNEIKLNKIDYFAIHPGGIKILQACEKSLKLTPEDNRYAYHVLKQFGNMSSATILFVLKELLEKISKDDHQKTIFSCAFGPGLTLESMLLKIQFQL